MRRRHRLERGDRNRERRAGLAAGDVDQVGDHRARGRAVAGAGALEQQPAGEIAFGDDRVGRPVDMRERVVARHQVRLDPLEQAAAAALALALLGFGHADQADAIAERVGLGDVGAELCEL